MDYVHVVDGHAIQINVPRDLAQNFAETIVRWAGPSHTGLSGTGYSRAKAGLALLDDALERLADRDRNGVKGALDSQRTEIAKAVTAIENLVGDLEVLVGLTMSNDLLRKRLTGPRYAELVELYDRALAAKRDADRDMHYAVGENVRPARDKIDLADAGLRHAHREISATNDAIIYPQLPDARIFELAKGSTEQLLRLNPTKPTARQMHAALDAGLNAAPAEGKLWAIYEGEKPHMLVDLRWRAFEERE